MRAGLALVTATIALAAVTPPGSHAQSTEYRTGLLRWRSATDGFAAWELGGGVTRRADGAVALEPAAAATETDPFPAGGYRGRNFYNGGSYQVAEATSPLADSGFGFSQAVVSWDADTPPGTWIEAQARVRLGQRLSRFYRLGIWAADSTTVERHSVEDEHDADGRVKVDTLVLEPAAGPADAVQVRFRLFSARPETSPAVRLAAVALSTPPARPPSTSPGDPARWNRVLDVPSCSQRDYPDGGQAWCSPTATSMVLGYWSNDTGPCEPRVRAAVAGVYDWVYDGHGNWPFNTAYAATLGMEAYVARLSGLAEAEGWIGAGVPVVMSYSWGRGELTGAPVASSQGHLAVLVGFDADGNPVMNDPAGADDAQVRRTYPRSQLEALWLEHSGGTAYLIHPPDHPLPGG
jgi:peptidase C39-like protein